MKNDLEIFLNSVMTTNRQLEDYVDWDKVKNNIENIEIDLATLDYLVKPKDEKELDQKIETLFLKHGEKAFKCLEILIAKRQDKKVNRFFYNLKENEINEYCFDTSQDVKDFIKKTKLINLFENVTNLKDYVFGVEVGMDTNARKSRGGKFNEQAIRTILGRNGYEFSEQKQLGKYMTEPISISKVDTKKIDFIFNKDEQQIFIETSFYNSGGSKISETLKSYADLNKNFDDDDNKLIWVVDGAGIKTIKKQLNEKWDDLTIMSIKQFEEFLSN